MTIWFVSRHPGALEWMLRNNPAFDLHVEHLDPQVVATGDTVIGSLPKSATGVHATSIFHYVSSPVPVGAS